MTADQVYFRLADPKVLRAKSKAGTRAAGISAPAAAVAGEDGTTTARTESGERIKLKHGGKSLARRLAEEQGGAGSWPAHRVEDGEIKFDEPRRKRRRRRKRGGDGS